MPPGGEYALADRRVRPLLRQICGPDGTAYLELKAIAVLGYLAARPREVCSRRELLEAVWGGSFVGEEVLTQAVHQLRRALGDEARNPRFIQTIPRQGYRLIAPVSWSEAPAGKGGRTGATAVGFRHALKRWRGWLLAGALVALVSAGWWVAPATKWRPASVADRPFPNKIAVLRFQSLGDQGDELLTVGIGEEIIGRLAGVPALGVIARTSTRSYGSDMGSYRQLQNELGVDYVLAGTVRWLELGSGEVRARVTPKLVSTADDLVLWAANYDLDPDDLLAPQIDIATEVVRQLGLSLGPRERRAIEHRPTGDAAAYRVFLRGLHHARDPDVSPESLARAAKLYERSLELDPTFARAWAELSIVRSYAHWLGYEPSDEVIELARTAAERALALAPDLAYSHLAMGYHHYYGHRRYSSALESFQRAERDLPGDAEVVGASGWVLRRMGRFEEAAQQLERSFDLDPRTAWLAREIGVTYRALRRYEAAAAAFDHSLALEPEGALATADLALNRLLWTGNTAEARRHLAATASEHPNSTWIACWLEMLDRDYEAAIGCAAGFDATLGPASWPRALVEGWAHQQIGRVDASRQAFERVRHALEGSVLDSPGFALEGRVRQLASERGILAWANASLGRVDAALDHARRSIEELPIERDALWGSDRIVYLAHVLAMAGEDDAAIEQLDRLLTMSADFSIHLLELDPRWDNLRDHPGYQRLQRENTQSHGVR